MTSDELRDIIKGRIEKTILTKNTLLKYKGGLSHLIKRIPIDAFGDEDVIRSYRQSLSRQARAVFGLVWGKIYDEMGIAGLPCVHPKNLLFRVQLPIIPTDCIELLAVATSFDAVAAATWGDVRMIEGNLYFFHVAVTPDEKDALMRLLDYYWPGEEPPPTAPLIGLSPKRRLIPMPAEMVVDCGTLLETGVDSRSEEDALAYRVYREMCARKMPLAEVEAKVTSIENLIEMKRGERGRARNTILEAVKALKMGNAPAFNRLWETAMLGQMGQAPMHRPGDAVRTWSMQRKEAMQASNARLMSQGWALTLNVAEPKKAG